MTNVVTSKIEQREPPSKMHEALQAISPRSLLAASIGAATLTAALVAGLFVAWSYYQNPMRRIEQTSFELENTSKQIAAELHELKRAQDAYNSGLDAYDSLEAEVARVQRIYSSLLAQLAKVRNASGRIAIRGTDPSVVKGPGSVEGMGGTYGLDNDEFVACPPGSFISSIQAFKPNDQDQIVQLRYACRSIKEGG